MTTILIPFFSYSLLLFGLFKLPERFWDFFLHGHLRIITVLREKKQALPFLGEIYRGEDLMVAFLDCEAKISLGLKILPNYLPRYKFYTDLLEHLFEAHRKMGIGIKKFIPEIRGALVRDLQFEKKVLSEFFGGLLQFLVVSTTTWSFVFLSSSLVEIPLDKKIIVLMALLQIIGVATFYFGLRLIKQKFFTKFSRSIEELYLFTSLLEVGLPLNEILERSGIMAGSLMSFKIHRSITKGRGAGDHSRIMALTRGEFRKICQDCPSAKVCYFSFFLSTGLLFVSLLNF